MKRNYISVLNSLISVSFGAAMIGLLLRFLFRFAGANPDAPFVTFLYDSTNPLLYPFRGIFSPEVVEAGHIVEFSTLIAIVIYAIIGWLLMALIEVIGQAAQSYTK